jgi:response regulator RpfG family c-di-GMP phosphodiesterase
VAVADVYDALTTKRVYKDAWTHEAAKGLLVKESGAHFDPVVVQAFLACEEQFIAIADRLREEEPPPSLEADALAMCAARA